MSTIFPREEKAEQIFDEILKNPHACERLKDTFFEAIPSAEESEGAGTDIPGTVFAAALFTAYENKDLSAFMMAVCNSSVFDLLRNSFLISIRFNDKGVENPIFLTDENGDLLSGSHQHACAKKYKMFHKLYEQQDEIPDYHMYMADHFEQIATNGGNMTVLELVEKYTSTKTGVRPTTVAENIGYAIDHRNHKDGCRNKSIANHRGCGTDVSGNHRGQKCTESGEIHRRI